MKDIENDQGQEVAASGEGKRRKRAQKGETLQENKEKEAEATITEGLLTEEAAEAHAVREETSLFRLLERHPDVNPEEAQEYAEREAKKRFRKPLEQLSDQEASAIIGDERSFQGFVINRLVEEYADQRREANRGIVEGKRENMDTSEPIVRKKRKSAYSTRSAIAVYARAEEGELQRFDERSKTFFEQAREDLEKFRAELGRTGLDAETIETKVKAREQELQTTQEDLTKAREGVSAQYEKEKKRVFGIDAAEKEEIARQETYIVFGGYKRGLALSTRRMGDFMEKVGEQYPQMIRRSESGEVRLDFNGEDIRTEDRDAIRREYFDRLDREVDTTRQAKKTAVAARANDREKWQQGSIGVEVERSNELNLQALFDLQTEGGRGAAVQYLDDLYRRMSDVYRYGTNASTGSRGELLNRHHAVWSHVLQETRNGGKKEGEEALPEDFMKDLLWSEYTSVEQYQSDGFHLESALSLYVDSLETGTTDYASEAIRGLTEARIGDKEYRASLLAYLRRIKSDSGFRNPNQPGDQRAIINGVLERVLVTGVENDDSRESERVRASAYRAAAAIGFERPYRYSTDQLAKDISSPIHGEAFQFIEGQLDGSPYAEDIIHVLSIEATKRLQSEMLNAIGTMQNRLPDDSIAAIESVKNQGAKMQKVLQRLEDIRQRAATSKRVA